MTGAPRQLLTTPPLDGTLRRFIAMLRGDRLAIGLAVAVAVLAAGASAALAPLLGAATDAILDGDRTGLARIVALAALVALVRFVAAATSQIRLVAAAERVVRRVRDQLAERLAVTPLRFVETHRAGDLITRATSEIETLSTFVRSQLPGAVTVAGYLTVSTVILTVTSWQLTLVTAALFIPAAIVLTRRFSRRSAAAFTDEAAAHATVEATFAETIDARETLQLTRAEAGWRARYRDDNDRLLATIVRTIRALLLLPVLYLVEAITLAGILAAGGWLVRQDTITVGTVVVFVVAADRLFDAVIDATSLVGQVQESRVTIARLLDLLDASAPPPPMPVTVDTPPALPDHATLTVDDVGYHYQPGTPVLTDITLHIPAGDRVALVGRTGAGKTTLAKILAGLYPPTTGSVRLDGHDLQQIPPGELRRRIALVPQGVHLLRGTLLDNLQLVPTAPDRDEIEHTIAELGLRGWITGLGGLDGNLGIAGERLSAGERQLIGLVRAALLDPSVLILDEATADLDPDTAALLERALERLRHDRTLIVIAHRPATVATLPRSLVLTDGRLVDGTATPTTAGTPTTPSIDARSATRSTP